MTRTQLQFTTLAGALALPGLISCAPGTLAGQASSMFNRPAAATPATSDGTILSMHPATPADRQASNSLTSGGTGNAAGGMAARFGGSTGGGNN